MNFADIKTLDERIIYAKTSNHESLPSNFGIDATPNYPQSTFTGADGYDILNDSYNFDEEITANDKNRKVYGKPLNFLQFIENYLFSNADSERGADIGSILGELYDNFQAKRNRILNFEKKTEASKNKNAEAIKEVAGLTRTNSDKNLNKHL